MEDYSNYLKARNVAGKVRVKLVSLLKPFDFCEKYTGTETLFRGANNPIWWVYKYFFNPERICCYYIKEDGEKKEICICCEHLWAFALGLLFMSLFVVIMGLVL